MHVLSKSNNEIQKKVQNLWPVQFFEITVKYAYLAVISRNGNGHRF